jgi:hypothetical protein
MPLTTNSLGQQAGNSTMGPSETSAKRLPDERKVVNALKGENTRIEGSFTSDKVLGLMDEKVQWLNGTQRLFATQRFEEARELKIPYVVAIRDIAGMKYALDGGIAESALANSVRISKLFTADGNTWIHDKHEVRFFAISLETRKRIDFGSFADLEKRNISKAMISQLIGINGLREYCNALDGKGLLENDFKEELFAAKVAYYALLKSELMRNDSDGFSGEVVSSMPAEDFDRVFLNEIAYANSQDLFILDAALKTNFDIERTSDEFECHPFTRAVANGDRDFISKALPYLKDPTADHQTLRNYKFWISDEGLRQWALNLKAPMEGV